MGCKLVKYYWFYWLIFLTQYWTLKDELLGLAESPESDEVFKNHSLDMDVLYRTGETQQVSYLIKNYKVDFVFVI